MSTEYRGYQIRKSGKDFLQVIDTTRDVPIQPRVTTIEAAKALINACAEHRVMTKDEHALVYGTTSWNSLIAKR